MGCDVHFFVEKKSTQFLREKKLNSILEIDDQVHIDIWESADVIEDNPEYHEVEDPRKKTIAYPSRFYSGRNYFLFGILAGVREDRVDPITEPRGIPTDICDILKEEYSRWGSDAHTASYYTLSELINFDWDKVASKSHLSAFMETIEKMKKISENTDDVRCVFWFDN